MDDGKSQVRGPELRLLVLGPSRVGKSSLGNLLLGQQVFDTNGGHGTIVVRGEACGRHLLVVDTQGWRSWKEEDVEEDEGDSLEEDDEANRRRRGRKVPKSEKLELLNALSLCEPGPHALLLVLPLLPFSQKESAALLARMELFTPGVWSHSIVVFTLGDKLEAGRGRTFQQYLEGASEQLHQLLATCRYRCHVLNNKASEDRTQVTRLLEKVEDRVMENSGWHFSLVMYCRLEEEWRRREREAKERWEREAKERWERWEREQQERQRHHRAPREEEDAWLCMDTVSPHSRSWLPMTPKMKPVCQG